MRASIKNMALLGWCIAGLQAAGGVAQIAASAEPIYPVAIASEEGGSLAYIACAGSSQVVSVDLSSRRVVRTFPMPAAPSGLALMKRSQRLCVTWGGVNSCLSVIDLKTGAEAGRVAAGHTAMSPVLSPDGTTLYVCSRFENRVLSIDLSTLRVKRQTAAGREPIAAALTPDGRRLVVANHLHDGPANRVPAAATVTVIDTERDAVLASIKLPDGSGLMRGICVSPDGRWACVAHILARYHYPTWVIDLGWINSNAITLVDLNDLSVAGTIVLDERHSGAANPWAVTWSGDGRWLCVTHAGTHELSVIDAPAMIGKLLALPLAREAGLTASQTRFAPYGRIRNAAARYREEAGGDFSFLNGLRRRIQLNGLGPRSMALAGARVLVANYFSDTISVLSLPPADPAVHTIPLGPAPAFTAEQRGELWFNDARLAFEGWQTCASCHDVDGRVDALNWDLLNDGAFSPKNVKSLLLAHATPPAMSLGVRDTASTAVRSGIRYILFSTPGPEVAEDMDAFLKALKPVPGPAWAAGRLSPPAERGKALFFRPETGCARCHAPPHYTNLKAYDVGTGNDYDKEGDRFDTPALIELWRTGPYLHDGSAPTLREVLTSANARDQHGRTSHLSEAELADLIEFLLSL